MGDVDDAGRELKAVRLMQNVLHDWFRVEGGRIWHVKMCMAVVTVGSLGGMKLDLRWQFGFQLDRHVGQVFLVLLDEGGPRL